jgi:hypothetical protein
MPVSGIPENDPETPKIVWALAPEGEGYIRLGMSTKTMLTLWDSRRLASLGEYAGLIYQSGVLVRPSRIYQGLLRPFLGPGVDDTVYAYISRPHGSFIYRDEKLLSLGQLRYVPAPRESVFVTFVSLADDVLKETRAALHPEDPAIRGTVLYWEWTMASDTAPDEPQDSERRYRRKIWPTV